MHPGIRSSWRPLGLACLAVALLAGSAAASTPSGPVSEADVSLDRGIALLEAGRLTEARETFALVLSLEPDHARAHLLSGVVAYLAGSYREALAQLDRAAELDSSLRSDRYYAGLLAALEGAVEAAGTSFDELGEQGPLSPLAGSALNLRRLMAPRPVPRAWDVSLTGGMEFDSDPLVLGDASPVGVDSDWRGVVRLSGSYRLLSREKGSLAFGYDGYGSFQIEENQLNLQTQAAWASGGYNVGPVRMGLRYDFAYSFIDTTDALRSLHRVTPSVAVREQDWGISLLYYQYYNQAYLPAALEGGPVDRDGYRNVPGFTQFFFLPQPFSYTRIGVLGDFLRTQGSEWSYDGIEASMASGYDFDYDIGFTWLYRFLYRDYLNASAAAMPAFSKKREDIRHNLTVELSKGLGEHWRVALSGAFTWNNSNVSFYEYERQIGGAYVTYSF